MLNIYDLLDLGCRYQNNAFQLQKVASVLSRNTYCHPSDEEMLNLYVKLN